MLEKVWRKGKPLKLLVGMQTSTATMKNSVEIPLKMFRSLIRFEFIFVYGVRKCLSFILLQVVDQFYQHHLLKRLSFLHCIFLPPLSKIRCPYVRGFISGLSILFH